MKLSSLQKIAKVLLDNITTAMKLLEKQKISNTICLYNVSQHVRREGVGLTITSQLTNIIKRATFHVLLSSDFGNQ